MLDISAICVKDSSREFPSFLYTVSDQNWVMAGHGGSGRDMTGHGSQNWVMTGYGGTWRDMVEHGGRWREMVIKTGKGYEDKLH